LHPSGPTDIRLFKAEAQRRPAPRSRRGTGHCAWEGTCAASIRHEPETRKPCSALRKKGNHFRRRGSRNPFVPGTNVYAGPWEVETTNINETGAGNDLTMTGTILPPGLDDFFDAIRPPPRRPRAEVGAPGLRAPSGCNTQSQARPGYGHRSRLSCTSTSCSACISDDSIFRGATSVLPGLGRVVSRKLGKACWPRPRGCHGKPSPGH